MARIIAVGAAQLGPVARDQLIVAEADLDRCREIQDNIFDFAKRREPQTYGPISRPKDAAAPGE